MRRIKKASERNKRRAHERIANEVQAHLNVLVKQCMNYLRENRDQEKQAAEIQRLDHEWYRYVCGHKSVHPTSISTLLPLFGKNVADLLRQINTPPPEIVKE